MSEKTTIAKLADVQAKLKAPKGQLNKFGNYHYRSCEDILEAVKPLLVDAGLAMTISDEPIMLGDRYYIKATVTVRNANGDGTALEVTAYAREAATKKGMDESQITGAASSYARKYALNGMFAIDDSKDADATNDHGKNQPAKPQEPDSTELDYMSMIADADAGNLKAAWDEAMGYAKQKSDKAMADRFTAAKDKRKVALGL